MIFTKKCGRIVKIMCERGDAGMVRKMVLWLLTGILLFGAIQMSVCAATSKQIEEIKVSTKESYTKTQESTQMESLNGFCGKMTSHQLWHMGINTDLLTNDGNKQYDMYSQMEMTSGGYYVNAYSAKEYSLVEALNNITQNGTKDAYNILVGFEWTNTEAGNIYGHACVINAILNGKVYFVESFFTRLGGEEGNVVVCSIEEFANIFADWTIYEGAIHFVKGPYANACKLYPTDLFVRTRFSMEMRSQPSVLGQNGSELQRSVSAGERLRVTGLMKNTHDEWYYRVQDGDKVGYIVAQSAVLDRTNVEDITLQDLLVIKNEQAIVQLEGTVRGHNGMVGAVEWVLTDIRGAAVMRKRIIVDDYKMDLAEFNDAMDFTALQDGAYTLTIYAETAAPFIQQDKLSYSHISRTLAETTVLIGNAKMPAKPRAVSHKEVLDGWYWQDDTWYNYNNNNPRNGWYRDLGAQYYLKENGAVTTGWAEIEGKQYLFSDTGALQLGWVRTQKGLRYALEDGTMATGWQTIDGSLYYFDETGKMTTRGTLENEGVTYQFQKDGKAVPQIKK